MAQGDALFAEHGLLPVAHFDLDEVAVQSRPVTKEGQIAWMRDAFGAMRLFSYRMNVSGSAMAANELASRLREVETNITAGSTTSATGSWNAADDHIGSLFIVHDNADSAGAAPEGEASVVVANSATVVTLESSLPMSAALAVNDDVTLISPKAIDAADGDLNFVVLGIAAAAPADNEWAWFQFNGLAPRAAHKDNSAVAAGEPVVADAARVGPFGSDAANLWVGYQIATHAADVTATLEGSPVVMALLPVYI